jgi:peptidoglycan/xylan/chitin deacetylase (PgdA/CDA1 family)
MGMRFATRPAWVVQAVRRPFARSGLGRTDRVHLTFDDGPDPASTPVVLERLRAVGMCGMFFLIGERVSLARDIALQLAREGHETGNHTFSHRRLGWANVSGAFDEVARCQELLPAESRWFRPPYGRLTPGLWLAARRLGLRVVTWTLDSNDWKCRSAEDAAVCAAEVLELVRPGDTILFHDTHPWIGPILDIVLPGLIGIKALARR